MRPGARHRVRLGDAVGNITRDRHDLSWIGDVDEEAIEPSVIDRPARATRDGDGAPHPPLVDVDHGQSERTPHRWIAHVGRQQDSSTRIEGESVGPDPDRDLGQGIFGAGRVDADGVLPPIRGERQVTLLGDQDAGDRRETADRGDVRLPRAIDHVHRVVRRVRHVQPLRARMDRRMVESARSRVSGKIDVTGRAKGHR